jgi:hypothetical protein
MAGEDETNRSANAKTPEQRELRFTVESGFTDMSRDCVVASELIGAGESEQSLNVGLFVQPNRYCEILVGRRGRDAYQGENQGEGQEYWTHRIVRASHSG